MKALTSTLLALSLAGSAFAQQDDRENPFEAEEIPPLPIEDIAEENDDGDDGDTSAPETEPKRKESKGLELPPNWQDLLVEEPEPPTSPRPEIKSHVEPPVPAPPEYVRSDRKLYTPFPPKPVSAPPLGWRLTRDSQPTHYLTHRVTLADGSSVDIEIAPFRIVAASGRGARAFLIDEPGFDPALKMQQTGTVGALLTKYDDQLAETEAEFDGLLSDLDDLLSALPSAKPQPEGNQ